jgi:hypothetical protein
MVRATLLALLLALSGGAPWAGGMADLVTAAWAADEGDAGGMVDPDGVRANAGNHADPDGRSAESDAGNMVDPDG